jgi:hypothetical protein
MDGQWIGSYSGDTHGQIILDLDASSAGSRGTARLLDANGLPGAACELALPTFEDVYELKDVPLMALRPGQPVLLTPDQAMAEYPNVRVPDRADVTLKVVGSELSLRWTTSVGTEGEAVLHASRAEQPSECPLIGNITTWRQFTEFALGQEFGKYIYRGQGTRKRLRTAFHRSHRKDLVRYVAEDIPVAHRLLTARTRNLFDLSSPEQNGAFWNLLQHHGYPTPLLDWSYSPFVAAFFAYRRNFGDGLGDRQPRLLAFDRASWVADFPQLQAVNFTSLHFSILEALAIENARAVPQQAISTLTNVDDIETYLAACGDQRGKPYLFAIDLPADERKKVMGELSLMGITAGSLFPGLDGTCEELKGRLFH